MNALLLSGELPSIFVSITKHFSPSGVSGVFITHYIRLELKAEMTPV